MSPKYRTAATKKIINNISSIIPNSKPQHIGAYLALQGEVDIKDWLNGCLHQLYLPVIEGKGLMNFYPYHPSEPLKASSIAGLWEPLTSQDFIAVERINTLLIPMVGFNQSLHRLGHGGGFYDRYLMHKKNQARQQQPILIGVAFACQCCQFEAMTWDIPMDIIITENQIITPESLH